AEKYKVPMAVTGFEPLDLAQGILQVVQMLEKGEVVVQNAYPRAVTYDGNKAAQSIISRTFQPVDRNWRGIGTIPLSGWGLRPELAEFDAENRFAVDHIQTAESPLCIAGEILQGLKKPHQCPAFGQQCTPQSPLGAPMVSAEGACSAYYRYARIENS
ncbi:MAG: HypD family hydrogenase formation protein, partial [Bellilinea sp.]